MDSRLLEKVLCRPVVNMSIHASLGLRFMVDELKGALGPGDLVIAPLEYSAYSDPIQDNEVHLLAIDFDPELIRMMPITARPRLFLGVMVMRAQATWKVLSGAWKDASPHSFFRADGFNEQGDLVSHLDKKAWPSAEQEHVHYKSEIVDPEFWPVIVELGEDVRRAGATLVIAWPGVAQSSYREGRADSLRMALQLKGLSILGEQARYVLPDSSFFDTHYHLRSEGREMRTLTLVEDLCGSGVVRCCSGR
ncbi:MAG: hypothetical protein JNM62_10795 [Flavobacteriales bacterium]|nr:hypothetical protein [Flavobacteriales bacterium]